MTSAEEVLAHYKSEWETKIRNMQPGPELDALVETKVFGRSKSMYLKPKPYSTDIAAAWEVADQLQNQGYVVCIELLPYEETSVGVYEADPAEQIAYAKSNKPAEAIAKAALLAVMGDD